MNYLFIYYTGTYNTRFLTEKVRETLLEEGDRADTVEIVKDTPPCDLSPYDIVGLGYPIYGFNSPLPLNQYLKKLKFKPGQKFFIYKNSGESMAMNNASSRIPLKIMKKNGCTFLGEYHFLMPYNIHFPFSEELMLKILSEDKKLLSLMRYNLREGRVHRIQSNFLLNAGAFFVSVQKVGGNVNSFFYRVDRGKCVLCQKCVKTCPTKNISLKNGKIVFGHSCSMCMRCSYFCPEKAIKIGMLEPWRVTDYYRLPQLWSKAEKDGSYPLKETTPFYQSYMKTFGEINSAYEALPPEKR